MLYNFATESLHTKELCSRLTLSEEKLVNLRFEPPLGGLGAMYAVHLRLIEKLIVDFLLGVIELLSLAFSVEAV